VKNNIYEISTTEGKRQQMYSRNPFEVCKESFVQIKMVLNTLISLREAARKCSNLGGQGYDRCNCQQQCITSKCKCRAAEKLCNSKCYNSLSCKNK